MTSNFTITPTKIAAVRIVETKTFKDDRGVFAEIYKASAWQNGGIKLNIKQVNYSWSHQGVLRGLHYQLWPKAQGKLVRVTNGEVYDVAVDIRRTSPTYGHWVAEVLTADNHRMIYIPAGFAHGFVVRSKAAEVIYYCDEEYAAEMERGIRWDDTALNIAWGVKRPLVSKKDQVWPRLAQADNNF